MSLESKTVLIVDDEPWVLDIIDESLTPLGCRTFLAQSGEEALAISAALGGNVDLLVTDVILPSMKGPELAKHFAKHSPKTKILYMSGFLSPAISPKEFSNREKAFIQKPFLIKDLVKLSERLLESKLD